MQIYKALIKPLVTKVTRRRCPQQNKCVFSNRRIFRKVCSKSRRWRGRLFHRRRPATVNERFPRLVRVLGTSHVAMLDDRRSRRWPVAVVTHPPNNVETSRSSSLIEIASLSTKIWRHAKLFLTSLIAMTGPLTSDH